MKEKKIIYIHSRPFPYNQTFYTKDSNNYFYFGQGPLYINHKPKGYENYEFEVWRGEVCIKK